MEENRLDRLEFYWRDFEILLDRLRLLLDRFWDFFRLGGFLEGGGKVLFLHKKLKISKNFRKKYSNRIFIFIIRATFSRRMKN